MPKRVRRTPETLRRIQRPQRRLVGEVVNRNNLYSEIDHSLLIRDDRRCVVLRVGSHAARCDDNYHENVITLNVNGQEHTVRASA